MDPGELDETRHTNAEAGVEECVVDTGADIYPAKGSISGNDDGAAQRALSG